MWNGNGQRLRDHGREARPAEREHVYAAAFDQGLWRRDAGAAATAFNQVFAPQFPGGGTDRLMIAPTVKNGKTRIYLTEGTAGAPTANFWRTDNANQTAATLLATQAAGATVPPGNGNPFPANYNGWQKLTSA